MLYVYHYDVAAVLLSIVTLILYKFRRNYPTTAGHVFVSLVITNLAGCFADACSAFTISDPSLVPLWVNYLLSIVYLFCNDMMALFFLLYVAEVTGLARRGRRWYLLVYGLAAIIAILIASTPWTHLVFYFSSSGAYTHGSLFVVIYIIALVMMLGGVAIILVFRHRLRRFQTMPLVIAVFIVIGAVAFQAAYPRMLVEGFAVAILAVLVYTCFEMTSDFMHGTSYCFNSRAFRDYIGRRMQRKDTFSVVAFGFEDSKYIRQSADLHIIDHAVLYIADQLIGIFGQRSVFYLGEFRFAVIGKIDSEPGVVEKIDQLMDRPLRIDDHILVLQPCICCLRHPSFVASAEEAVDSIMSALDDREERGGDHVFVVDGTSLERRRREGDVLAALRRGIERKSFQVHFQPIYSVAEQRFISAEALVRLNDEACGPISPDDFIPLAEHNGMVMPIGSIVFEKVCQYLSLNNITKRGVAFVEVNLSAAQCMQESFAEEMLYMMSMYGLDPGIFNFEMTETSVISDQVSVRSNMSALIEAGSGFSLDDYGSGFASAENLTKLSFKLVKIDRTILWSAMEDSQAMAVLTNTIRMIKDLGRQIVVEGVETEEMAEMLIELGCDYLQGFYYSMPLSGDEYLAFLEGRR